MSRAEKLRKRMTQTKADWTGEDLERLYLGYGFQVREGSKHRIYSHPVHRHLRATVTRSPQAVATGYIQEALSLLDQLDELNARSQEEG